MLARPRVLIFGSRDTAGLRQRQGRKVSVREEVGGWGTKKENQPAFYWDLSLTPLSCVGRWDRYSGEAMRETHTGIAMGSVFAWALLGSVLRTVTLLRSACRAPQGYTVEVPSPPPPPILDHLHMPSVESHQGGSCPERNDCQGTVFPEARKIISGCSSFICFLLPRHILETASGLWWWWGERGKLTLPCEHLVLLNEYDQSGFEFSFN